MATLVDQWGNPTRSQPSGTLSPWQRNFYHSAAQDNKTPYQPTRLQDIDQLLPPYDWQTLLSASRSMYANLGPCRAACEQLADNAVGNSYLPEFAGSPSARARDWGRIARDWLMSEWFPAADLRGAPYDFQRLLWLDSIAVDRDGDVLYLLTQDRFGFPALQHISANRIRTGHHDNDGEPIKKGRYRGAVICNGVIKSRAGRTIAFRVHTGDDEDEDSYREYSSRDLRQIFDPEWHEQSRGIPAGAHALRFLANSLQSHEWEHVALMMLSSIGLIERNALGLPDEDDPANTLGSNDAAPTGDPGLVRQSFEGGTIRYFSTTTPGAGLESISHDRPGEQWEAFHDRTIRLFASGVNWPYELIWKSGEVNGVTIRNIQERAQRAVRDRQALLDPHARAQVTYALSRAIDLRLIPPAPSPRDLAAWRFRKPRQISIDPGRDTQSEISAIESHHTTLRSVVESRGATIDEHYDTIIEDELLWRAKRAAAGLDPAPAPPPDSDPEDQDDNPST